MVRKVASLLEDYAAVNEAGVTPAAPVVGALHEAAFAGKWVSFEPIWSWPKPVQRPHPPILFATLGPSPLVIRHADGWLPLSAKDPELPARIAALRARIRTRDEFSDYLDGYVSLLVR